MKRVVTGPDGLEFEVEPLRDYFCEAPPTVQHGAYLKIVEDFFNWARAESLWILGFGTGCGAIEMRPLMTPRFDAYRYGIQWRPTPRQANLLVISGYLSVKTLKRAIRAYEQMQKPEIRGRPGFLHHQRRHVLGQLQHHQALDDYMPVDLYIAGCMPRPEALLAGFEDLKS
jgi:NADH-quinone oxidoreductase subunit B